MAILKLPYTVTELEVLLGEAQYVQSNTEGVGKVMWKEEEFGSHLAILKMLQAKKQLEVIKRAAWYV